MQNQNKNSHRHVCAVAAICLFSGLPPAAPALDLGYGDWQLHGFLSQGYTYTSGNDFFGNSQGAGSLDFTELGVNVLGHPWPNLLVAVQGLYRNAAGSDQEDFRLDYANLDYRLPLGGSSHIGVRAGRVKNPFALYNEGRDAIWNRPGVLLPTAIYFDALALRQPEISSDGGLLYGRHALGDHALSAEFLVAEPLDNSGGATEFLTGIPNAPGELGGRPMFIGRAGYEWMEGRLRLVFSVVDLDRDFESSSPFVPSGNIKTTFPIGSVQVNLEDWTFTGEYGQILSERSGFTPGGIPIENTSEAYYVQAQYRFAPRWSALLRYDAFFVNIDDRDGRDTARLIGLPRHRFFAKDITFGLRWEFAQNWLIAAEYHNVNGTAGLSTVDNPELNLGGGDPHWDLFALMLSFRF
ncbi:MAG: hypothetical protein ACREX9_03500 [Gammaproteobacteria bacterium]